MCIVIEYTLGDDGLSELRNKLAQMVPPLTAGRSAQNQSTKRREMHEPSSLQSTRSRVARVL